MIEKKNVIKEIRSWTLTIFGAFFIAMLINSKVFAKVQVQQCSMEDTLYTNQQLIVDKLSYNFGEPKRGDIVIFLENKQRGNIIDDTVMFINNIKSKFENTDTDSRLIKRVIGIPGDEVDIKDGYVYVNGEKLNEPYVKGETNSRDIEFPFKVGENKLFVLGDNRPVSKDSRIFGLIDYKQVEGKAIFRVFPFNEAGTINKN